MVDQFSYYSKLTIADIPIGFEHSLAFFHQEERKLESGKPSIFAMEREVEIVYRGNFEGMPRYQIFLYKTEIFLERKSIPSKVLIESLSYVFDELLVKTDFHGRIICIANYPYIRYRWGKMRTELVSEYFTEEYQQYFIFIDEIIKDEIVLIDYLNTPEMYGLYFNGLRRQYLCEEAQKNEFKFQLDGQVQTVEESIKGHLKESEANKLATLEVEGRDIEKNIHVKGKFVYLNGIIDTAKKKINLNDTKINYSARWVGLKNYFQ